MNRRRFLATAATIGAAGLAGCTSSGDSANPATASQTSIGQQTTSTSTDSQTQTSSTSVEASVTSAEYRVQSPNGYEEGAIVGHVKNTGTKRLRSVAVTGKFYDGQDSLLTTRVVKISDLAPGEVWDAFVIYVDNPSKVERGELVITQATTTPRTYFPDGFSVTESGMEVPQDDNRPIISATVENTSGVDDAFLMAVPKVYAENGNVLGTAITSKSGLSDGKTWNFNSRVRILNGEWTDRAADHEVVLLQ